MADQDSDDAPREGSFSATNLPAPSINQPLLEKLINKAEQGRRRFTSHSPHQQSLQSQVVDKLVTLLSQVPDAFNSVGTELTHGLRQLATPSAEASFARRIDDLKCSIRSYLSDRAQRYSFRDNVASFFKTLFIITNPMTQLMIWFGCLFDTEKTLRERYGQELVALLNKLQACISASGNNPSEIYKLHEQLWHKVTEARQQFTSSRAEAETFQGRVIKKLEALVDDVGSYCIEYDSVNDATIHDMHGAEESVYPRSWNHGA
jgi:hypothetical protein